MTVGRQMLGQINTVIKMKENLRYLKDLKY